MFKKISAFTANCPVLLEWNEDYNMQFFEASIALLSLLRRCVFPVKKIDAMTQ